MKFLDTIEYIRSEYETEKEFREFWNVLHYIFSILRIIQYFYLQSYRDVYYRIFYFVEFREKC